VDAEGVAAGAVAIVTSADVLEVARARRREPVPIAVHRTGDWCTVLFLTSLPLGAWRTEVVPVYRGDEVNATGGATGGMARRSEIQPGKPFTEGVFGVSADDGLWLIAADGVSADDALQMRWQDEVVAETAVAAHGYFVISALLPRDAQITVEPK
jgi:hypothetical protein